MMGLLRYRSRHRTYLCYDAADRDEVSTFVDFFDHTHDIFIAPAPGVAEDAALPGGDTSYVLRRIRSIYMSDSTITLVLIGACTWARCSVDWEIQASLQPPGADEANGLLGLVLPSASSSVRLPLRLQMNLSSGYASLYPYTLRLGELANYLNEAFHARSSRAHCIVNPGDRQQEDAACP